MNRIQLKSVVLGIGIGIIITAIAGIVYDYARSYFEELTKGRTGVKMQAEISTENDYGSLFD